MYGTLENMMQKKQYNFKWVGIISTIENLSEMEQKDLEKKFEKINAYPIFITAMELQPYLLYYENILRPLFHNFKDLYDMKNEFMGYWKDYCEINKRIAEKIVSLKIKTVWIHNNHLLMVPHYIKKVF